MESADAPFTCLDEGFAEQSPVRKPVDSLLRYLEGNKDRMNYCERLHLGRVIGSGMVGGTCKNLVGRRSKQTGACWRMDRVNKIAIIVANLYGKM